MPNWCENELRVTGKKKDLETFIALAAGSRSEETDFNFENFIPYPQEFADADRAQREWEEVYKDVPWGDRPPRPADGYNSGGYEWCIANWGTKWPARDPSLGRTQRGCNISFETAWGPPAPVIRKLGALFPGLTFSLKYWEGGAGFKGCLTVKGDETLEEWEDSYCGGRGG